MLASSRVWVGVWVWGGVCLKVTPEKCAGFTCFVLLKPKEVNPGRSRNFPELGQPLVYLLKPSNREEIGRMIMRSNCHGEGSGFQWFSEPCALISCQENLPN